MIYIKVTSPYNINNITISNVSQYQFDKDMHQFNVTDRQRLPITNKSELIWVGEIGNNTNAIYIKCVYDNNVINNTIQWFETKNDLMCPYIIDHLSMILLKNVAKQYYSIDEQEIEELFC